MMKMKFSINMHIQILNAICSQYKRIYKPVLIIQNVCFLVKEMTQILLKLGFIKFAIHQLRTRLMSDC
jgi:hypothetical protein